jgi:hypothetical protein
MRRPRSLSLERAELLDADAETMSERPGQGTLGGY